MKSKEIEYCTIECSDLGIYPNPANKYHDRKFIQRIGLQAYLEVDYEFTIRIATLLTRNHQLIYEERKENNDGKIHTVVLTYKGSNPQVLSIRLRYHRFRLIEEL